MMGKVPRHTLLKQGVNEISNHGHRNSGEKCRFATLQAGACRVWLPNRSLGGLASHPSFPSHASPSVGTIILCNQKKK
jgi:hypothetical protein